MAGSSEGPAGTGRSIRTGVCALAAGLLAIIALPNAASAEFSGANGTIAYGKGNSIWKVTASGSNPKRITRHAAEPALSRNGRLVAFVRHDNIWVSSLNGNQQFQLTDTAPYINASPSFSPDNEAIVYDGPPAGGPCCSDIWVYRDGVGNDPLTTDGNVDFSPAYSPDGEHIVWTRDGGLSTMTATGTDFRSVIHNAYTPQYSPDGHRIIYGAGGIHTAKANGKKRETLTGGHRVIDSSPVYSPDGKSILFERSFQRGTHGHAGVYMADADGSNLHLLVRHGNEPSWAPR